MKNEKGVALVVILLVIIILLFSVIIFYLISNQKEQKHVIQTESTSITSTDDKIVDSTLVSSDNKYKTYITGLKNSINNLKEKGIAPSGEKTECKIIVNGYGKTTAEKNGINSLSIKYNGEAYLNLSEDSKLAKKYGTKYKIKDNVVKAGIQEYGQDSTLFIWTINDAGVFSYKEIGQFDENVKFDFKDNTKLKNIVTVEQIYNGEANVLVAIDIDGQLIEI